MSKQLSTEPETDNVYEEWEEAARELIVSKMNELKLSYKELAQRLERLGVVESAGQLNRKINRKRFSAAFMLACLDAMEEESSG
ncbi:DUF6471 domain-containing protein [Caballeronia sp. RCC_10]|uniref:DUF6471 domain-containing protein n=1 Tax=Caballeronia sp. RCC_10 TaxID=3239227 RepID=UPI003524CD84